MPFWRGDDRKVSPIPKVEGWLEKTEKSRQEFASRVLTLSSRRIYLLTLSG